MSMSQGLSTETITMIQELRKEGRSISELAFRFGLSKTTIKKYTKEIEVSIPTKEKAAIKETSAVDEKYKKNIIKQLKVKSLCDKLTPGETYSMFEKAERGYAKRKVTIIAHYKNYIDAVVNGYRESIHKSDILTGHVVIKGVTI